MTTTVLVPSDEGRTALAALDNVSPVVYDPAGPMPEEAADAEVLVVPFRHVQRTLAAMREMPKLRLVQTLSAGTDGWQGRLPDGVRLSNCRGAHGGSTAEWAATALLAVYRDIPQFVRDQVAHEWHQIETETLDGKRVLILGAGDLGLNLRARLVPFGASVTMVAHTAHDGAHGLREVPDLLGGHDAVVIMVPYNDETHQLVDAEFLAPDVGRCGHRERRAGAGRGHGRFARRAELEAAAGRARRHRPGAVAAGPSVVGRARCADHTARRRQHDRRHGPGLEGGRAPDRPLRGGPGPAEPRPGLTRAEPRPPSRPPTEP